MSTTETTPTGSSTPVGISAAELRELLHEDPDTRVLDVRTGGEFETVHIPGSFNVPLDKLSEHVRDVAALEHPVVLVCQSGARASKAQEKLSAAGKTNLRVLDGGIASWQNVGGDVVRGAEKWPMDRQVRGVAGSIVLASILASVAFPQAKWVAGFVGGGLLFSAVSGTCGMAMLLGKLPYNRGPVCDLDDVISSMKAGSGSKAG